MSNIYQKALDELVSESCPKRKPCRLCDIKNTCNCLMHDNVKVLQRLINKNVSQEPDYCIEAYNNTFELGELSQALKLLQGMYGDIQVKTSRNEYIEDEYGSDRGNYRDMYITYGDKRKRGDIDYAEVLSALDDLLSRALKDGTMEGYKGGEFDISPNTDVKVSIYGYSGYNITKISVINNIAYLVIADWEHKEKWELD